MAVVTLGRAHGSPPSLQTPVNHCPTVRSLRSPSTTKRPCTTAACGVRRPDMRSTKVSVSQPQVTSAAVPPPGSSRTWSGVRHPPPSGWLDEPGRLKGGGVPSPYSNSLKPTIIVTGILVTDRRFDLFQCKANRGDRIATRPKVLAREIAIMAPKRAGDGNRTFALEKPNDRCHGMLGRDLDAYMHMIWHHMSLDDAACLLAGQLMKDWPKLTTNLPNQLLPATFGHKYNMVLAIPARMRQALIEL